MDAPCKIQGNIHVLLCLIHKINVSRILGTYQFRVTATFLYLRLIAISHILQQHRSLPGTALPCLLPI